MAGLGPVPLAGLMLSEMGATVLRIERAGKKGALLPIPDEHNLDRFGREILAVDLKRTEGRDFVLSLCRKCDVLMEGFRPGVMERLGMGPEDCTAANEKLIYARMTGFGQEGPLSDMAGHDLTYLAYSGALHAIGRKGSKPVPPLNYIADYGGGTMFLISGILAALFERSKSGKGQVVDAAMIDGVSNLSSLFFSMAASGLWSDQRGQNLLDTGSPFYDTYETSDGKHVAVACLEPQFFAEFVRIAELPESHVTRQYDRAFWPQLRADIATLMLAKTRDEWTKKFDGSDACVAPVLTFAEAKEHPHNKSRLVHTGSGGFVRAAPAPRFSRTGSATASASSENQKNVLISLGLDQKIVDRLVVDGVLEL